MRANVNILQGGLPLGRHVLQVEWYPDIRPSSQIMAGSGYRLKSLLDIGANL